MWQNKKYNLILYKEVIMEIFKIVSGPILGTIIGFGTNYLAIKMLFRPHKTFWKDSSFYPKNNSKKEK